WRQTAATLPPRLVAQYTVALNVFTFFAVALLSGSLAEELRSAGVALVQASSEIADLQALNQDVIDSLQSGLVTTDPMRRVLTFNRGAEQITGIPAFSAIGRPVGEVLQLPPSLVNLLADELADSPTTRHEFRFRTADLRGEIELGMSASHLETPGGRAGYILSFQDVTELKRLERNAVRQQRLAA